MTVVDDRGEDLQEYLTRITTKPSVLKWKLVASAPNDYGWCGDWIADGIPCFLAILMRESEVKWVAKESRKGKKKPQLFWLDTYRIWLCGNDDLFMDKQGMRLDEAIELFSLITTDGISRKELKEMGFIYG